MLQRLRLNSQHLINSQRENQSDKQQPFYCDSVEATSLPLCTHHSKPILPVSHSNSSTRPSLAENVASIFNYVLCCFTPWQKPKHVFESCLLVSSGLYFDNIHVSKLRIWQSWTFCLICQTQGESEFFSAWENTSRNPFLSNYIHIPGLFR